MSNQFPDPEPANLPDDAVPLLPKDGLDGFTLFAFEIDGQLGIGLTIHTQTLGDFIVPVTGTQIGALATAFKNIAKMDGTDVNRILAQLRRQA
jgi:hypothetical protein